MDMGKSSKYQFIEVEFNNPLNCDFLFFDVR